MQINGGNAPSLADALDINLMAAADWEHFGSKRYKQIVAFARTEEWICRLSHCAFFQAGRPLLSHSFAGNIDRILRIYHDVDFETGLNFTTAFEMVAGSKVTMALAD
jgi:hypothetical protein